MSVNICSPAERQEVLESIPQTGTFRFLDEITELSSEHIVATYHFRGDEWFYSGHFPGDPVTPGVILIEAMAQAGLVALGLYILRTEQPDIRLRSLFSECAIEFLAMVPAGERVTISGQKVYWRRNKLQSKVELRLASGEVAAYGTVSGLGVKVG